jgi:hypothetical protein
MATTLYDILTRASIRLGGDPIQSFADTDSRETQIWSALWQPALDELLIWGKWSFASKTFDLNRLIDAPADPAFQYQFSLPSDYLDLRYLMDAGGARILHGWQVEGDRLLACHDRIILKYLRRYEENQIGDLPVWFQDLLVTRLIYDGSVAVTAVNSDAERAYRDLSNALQRAKLRDANAEPSKVLASPSSLRLARFG